MIARRIEPRVRCDRFGLCELPSKRIVFVTHSGLEIGRLPPQQRARDHGAHAERMQDLILHRRPLAWDQVLVTALCTQDRRP